MHKHWSKPKGSFESRRSLITELLARCFSRVDDLKPRPQRLQNSPGAATVSVLRLDELVTYATGNKVFKLKHNLLRMQAEGHARLLTFGGAYSNHLVAVAAIGRRLGFETIGVVRGELNEP